MDPPPRLVPFPALLDGLRVLDASRILAGPHCGQLLGDLGADVIKIERPGLGDDTREWGPPFHPTGPAAYYLACNRNKRGIALDMGQPRGRALLDQLVRKSDVVLENYRADSAAKLGLGPAHLLEVNPRIIVCSISGFGRTGPMRDLPGYDFAIQALSGLMSITGPTEGPPAKVGVAVTDVLTGLHALSAILACLIARSRTGHGYHIDLGLLDCALASQVNVVQSYLAQRQSGRSPAEAVPARQGNAHLQIVPYQLFQTADGWMVVAVGNDNQWQRFAPLVAPNLADPERYRTNPDRVRHRHELVPQLEQQMQQRTTAAWQEAFEEVGIPHAPMWTYAELFAHQQARARGFQVSVRDHLGREVDLVGSPFHVSPSDAPAQPAPASMPPELGEHTDQVLAELCDLDAETLAALRQDGVIG